ncbi:ATPase [Virgibacillus xinjiangensis]|uniref:ATPase n=1 Tax=Virgibacillus xinjiangensis TaxID=393090 RepID=A0ABV7CSE8_9BACI
MKKPFWIPLTAALGTMALLYMIGLIADIEVLSAEFSFTYTEFSFLPIVVGVVVGFVTEWVMKYRKGLRK